MGIASRCNLSEAMATRVPTESRILVNENGHGKSMRCGKIWNFVISHGISLTLLPLNFAIFIS